MSGFLDEEKMKKSGIYTKVAGVTYENRQQLVKNCRVGQRLQLIREYDNTFDKNAIAVYAGSGQLGYIKKDLAEMLSPQMDRGIKYICEVTDVTGGEYNKEFYGLNIKIIQQEKSRIEDAPVVVFNRVPKTEETIHVSRNDMMSMEESRIAAKRAYDIIDLKAGSNAFIQGISGIFGFPWTLVADAATLFTHYGDMINRIRALYFRSPFDSNTLVPIIKGMSKEVFFDLVADKLVGSIPVVGIYFNAICAKTLTWRIGIVFAMLSARGEDVTDLNVENTTILVRQIFPQNDAFTFKQPSYEAFEKIVTSVQGDTKQQYERKISEALSAFK